jgi:hypothetical protein
MFLDFLESNQEMFMHPAISKEYIEYIEYIANANVLDLVLTVRSEVGDGLKIDIEGRRALSTLSTLDI